MKQFNGVNTLPLTGYSPDTIKQEKKRSKRIELLRFDVKQNYADLVAHGLDTVQEAFELKIKDFYLKKFEEEKEKARKLDKTFSTSKSFKIIGLEFQMKPVATKGYSYNIENNDYIIMVRSNSMDYNISVRYLAQGLWQRGIETLKQEVLKVLNHICIEPKEKDFIRLSRLDFAFDFQSKKFTKDMTPNLTKGIVAGSKIKNHFYAKSEEVSCFSKGGAIETLTIGSKKRLQVQVYNKSKEVLDNPSKLWFKKVWQTPKYNYDDIWRLELRFFSKFLRDRGILTLEEALFSLQELITEALVSRSLRKPSKTDTNRSRWKLHALWSLAYDFAGCGVMLPVGRRITQAKEVLEEKLKKQIAGTLRTYSVLKHNRYDDDDLAISIIDVVNTINEDIEHSRKIDKAKERYKNIEKGKL